MSRRAYRINFHRYLGALDRFLVRGQASQRGVSVHGHKVGLCVRDVFGSAGNRTTTFIHEREIVRDWSVGRFIAWSVRSEVGVCERVPNLLVRTRGGRSVLVGRARAPPRLHLCATLPSQEQRNNGTSSSRVRVARGERADRTRLLVCLVPVHPLKPCTSTEGSLKTVFQAPGFNSRLLVTAPWRTCSSVEAGPRPRSNALVPWDLGKRDSRKGPARSRQCAVADGSVCASCSGSFQRGTRRYGLSRATATAQTRGCFNCFKARVRIVDR